MVAKRNLWLGIRLVLALALLPVPAPVAAQEPPAQAPADEPAVTEEPAAEAEAPVLPAALTDPGIDPGELTLRLIPLTRDDLARVQTGHCTA